MKTEYIKITPKLAERYLKHSDVEIEDGLSNRNVIPRIVKKYAMSMKEGHWNEETGETIKINKEGVVIDGQHRLNAVILADTSIWFLIAYDIENEAYAFIDIGAARTTIHALQMIGAYCPSRIAPIIKAVMQYNKIGTITATFKPAHHEVIAAYKKHRDQFNASTKWAQEIHEQPTSWGLVELTTIGALHFICTELDMKNSIESFFTILIKREGTSTRMMKELEKLFIRSIKSRDKIYSRSIKWAMIIKTFHEFHYGNTSSSPIIRKNEKLQKIGSPRRV